MTNDPEAQTGGGDAHTDMATLLEASEDYRSPHRGEIVEGTVMEWDRDGMLVDIGAKSEGLVLKHEMQSLGANPETKISAGDKVLVYVVQPDTAEGQIVLSIDRARGEQGWHTLQERFESGEAFDGEVTGYNKGGLLVNVEGVNAFVPLSQVVGVRPSREDGSSGLAEAVGKTLRLKVIEINRRRNRVILSERAAMQEWRSAQKERLIQELREGDIRRGRISSVRSFGVFVDLGGADGLAHLSELSWERDKTPAELFNVGDEVDVYVTKVDAENKKIALSLRRARPEQWDAVVAKYHEGQVVTGLVTKLVTFGAFARIEGPVEGLIHVSELVDRRIGHPKEVVREGDLLPLKIVRIERDRHRLGLSLRRARDEGEGMGYVFSDGGEVLSVPDSIREEYEAREGPIPAPSESYDEQEPAAEAPATDEPPPAPEPVAEEATSVEEPVVAEPGAESPAIRSEAQESSAEAPAVEPATEQPMAEETAAPATEAPSREEPSADLATEQPASEAPAVEPTAEPASAEESATEQPAAAAPSVEQPAAEPAGASAPGGEEEAAEPQAGAEDSPTLATTSGSSEEEKPVASDSPESTGGEEEEPASQ